jgi:site-specific recombinase XerD
MAVLKAWIADRQIYFGDADTNALFISQHGKRMSYDAVRKLWIKYTEGITDKKITPHCLRHTCATNLYEKTGDIYLASAQLHHSSISTTMRYAEISNKKLQQANAILDDLV